VATNNWKEELFELLQKLELEELKRFIVFHYKSENGQFPMDDLPTMADGFIQILGRKEPDYLPDLLRRLLLQFPGRVEHVVDVARASLSQEQFGAFSEYVEQTKEPAVAVHNMNQAKGKVEPVQVTVVPASVPHWLVAMLCVALLLMTVVVMLLPWTGGDRERDVTQAVGKQVLEELRAENVKCRQSIVESEACKSLAHLVDAMAAGIDRAKLDGTRQRFWREDELLTLALSGAATLARHRNDRPEPKRAEQPPTPSPAIRPVPKLDEKPPPSPKGGQASRIEVKEDPRGAPQDHADLDDEILQAMREICEPIQGLTEIEVSVSKEGGSASRLTLRSVHALKPPHDAEADICLVLVGGKFSAPGRPGDAKNIAPFAGSRPWRLKLP